MADVRKQLNKIARDLRRGIGFATSKKNMQALGKTAIRIIVERTRRGKGVVRTGARQRQLKRLSKNYIAYRRTQKLDRTTSPGKSNLTFTGQLLRSMTIKSSSNRRVTWGPNKRRRRGGLTNEKLGEIVSSERPFNNLSAREIAEIARDIEKILDRQLSKI